MKTTMQRFLGIVLMTWVSASIGHAAPLAPVFNHGLLVLDEKMSELLPTTNAPTAAGHVKTSFHQVARVTQQSLLVAVEDLETNTTYQVRATMTNGVSYAAGALLTNTNGWGALRLRARTGPGRNPPHPWPLPPELQPASQIVRVEVLNANSDVVLDSDVSASNPGFHMHAMADLRGPAGSRAFGKADIGADSTAARFAVHGLRLPRNADVQVRMDGTVVGTGKRNRGGVLFLKGTLPGTINAARIQLIEVLDAGGVVLLTGNLPN